MITSTGRRRSRTVNQCITHPSSALTKHAPRRWSQLYGWMFARSQESTRRYFRQQLIPARSSTVELQIACIGSFASHSKLVPCPQECGRRPHGMVERGAVIRRGRELPTCACQMRHTDGEEGTRDTDEDKRTGRRGTADWRSPRPCFVARRSPSRPCKTVLTPSLPWHRAFGRGVRIRRRPLFKMHLDFDIAPTHSATTSR